MDFGKIFGSPTPIQSSVRFASLVSGSVRACGLSNGKTYCWGRLYGHRADSPSIPTLVEGQGR